MKVAPHMGSHRCSSPRLPISLEWIEKQRGLIDGGPSNDLSRYANSPREFLHDVLSVSTWHGQDAVIDAIAGHRRLVAVRSGQKTGKTLLAAALCLWWASTRSDAFVLLTSGSDAQLRHQLWREIRRLHQRAIGRIGGTCSPDPQYGLRWPDGRMIVGRTTRDSDPERLAGYSSPRLFVVIDEASRYPDVLYEALYGNLLGGGRLLAISNPTRTSGWYYRVFREQLDDWARVRLCSRDTPNATGRGEPIPGLATQESIEELERLYGADSPVVRVRVDGEFPEGSDNGLFGIADVERAVERWRESSDEDWVGHRLVLGVDVARYGSDASCVALVRGDRCMAVHRFRSLDGHELAGEVMRLVAQHRRITRESVEHPLVVVDEVGVGASVLDVLRRERSIDVVGVNVGAAAYDKSRYRLRRDEVYFAVRDWLRDGDAELPSDELLVAELLAHEYMVDERGRLRVESKDKIKSSIGRSPDSADALALAIGGPAGSQLATAAEDLYARTVAREIGSDIDRWW